MSALIVLQVTIVLRAHLMPRSVIVGNIVRRGLQLVRSARPDRSVSKVLTTQRSAPLELTATQVSQFALCVRLAIIAWPTPLPKSSALPGTTAQPEPRDVSHALPAFSA